MKRLLLALFALALLLCPVGAGGKNSIPAPPDPFLLYDSFSSALGTYRQTSGLAQRSWTINPAVKTLVLLVGGQSLSADTTPTLYTPTNTSVIDNLNAYDGGLYPISGPMLGTTFTSIAGLGPGNIAARVADTLVSNGSFDRVIVATMSIGGTTAAAWGTGIHANRMPVAMARLASRGVVPGMTGVTFGCIWDLGEQDLADGTSQVSFAASANTFIANLQATGFNGRIFIPLESGTGQTSNAIRSAQASLWNGTTVFSGGDFDAPTGRVAGDHFNDAGAADAATRMINAMHASGAPYT